MDIGLSVLEGPVGNMTEPVMDEIVQVLESVFTARVMRVPRVMLPAETFDARRGQHSAPLVLRALLDAVPEWAGPPKMLAITGVDMFIPMLSFVYGQAQLGGRGAIVSLARLRQEFYGLPANSALLVARARKEAVHETGHLFGLLHCESPGCAMRLSANIRELDLKGDWLCSGCAAMLTERVA